MTVHLFGATSSSSCANFALRKTAEDNAMDYELAAATVAIQLDRTLKRELEFPICSSTFWTDSTTVLQYLKNDSKRFHTYVANLVAFIRSNHNAIYLCMFLCT